MSGPHERLLNPTDARVFRVTHVDNVPWLLDHGLHCQSSATHDPNFTPIGMPGLIGKRRDHALQVVGETGGRAGCWRTTCRSTSRRGR